jgi:hypothetical protein
LRWAIKVSNVDDSVADDSVADERASVMAEDERASVMAEDEDKPSATLSSNQI